MFLLWEEIDFAHDDQLDGEEEQREGIDEDQRVAIADLKQVGEFENLQQVGRPHDPLRREQLAKVLPVSFGTVEPLQ